MPCAVCDASDLRTHLRVGGEMGDAGLIPTTDQFGTALSDIVRCESCGHMQLERMPSAEDLRESYSEAESSDYVEEEAGQRETARRTLAAIERHVAEKGVLLDLGCWVGYLPSEAEKRGWTAIGVEPSEFASRYARERLGLDVRTAELFDAELEPGSFDAIVLGDVIEHLPDPGAALDRFAELLAPGGVLALILPDAGSRLARTMGQRWWSVIPTHVQYFTRPSMRELLARHGFETLEIETAPKVFTVRYYLSRIGGYSPPLARVLTRVAERLGRADRLWGPDFRDRMLALSRASR